VSLPQVVPKLEVMIQIRRFPIIQPLARAAHPRRLHQAKKDHLQAPTKLRQANLRLHAVDQ
jgi:hypothetical protein